MSKNLFCGAMWGYSSQPFGVGKGADGVDFCGLGFVLERQEGRELQAVFAVRRETAPRVTFSGVEADVVKTLHRVLFDRIEKGISRKKPHSIIEYLRNEYPRSNLVVGRSLEWEEAWAAELATPYLDRNQLMGLLGHSAAMRRLADESGAVPPTTPMKLKLSSVDVRSGKADLALASF